MTENVLVERRDRINLITIDRPHARNAVDPETADALKAAFEAGEADEDVSVHILTGADGVFCAGYDLKSLAVGRQISPQAPMGPTWLMLSKPSIAAVEGPAVAGGLELALMCDMRVAGEGAVFGVYCRRWGVPLIDGGTVRLPRLIGQSRALDMILTGRPVEAAEALSFGLANRVVEKGEALNAAVEIASQLAAFPQTCLRNDRASALKQWSLPMEEALRFESEIGRLSFDSDAVGGASRFADGKGRGGDFAEI